MLPVLQIEYMRDGAYKPSASAAPLVPFTNAGIDIPGGWDMYSDHATQVAKFLCGFLSPAAAIVDRLYFLEATYFHYEGLQAGKTFRARNLAPLARVWNLSYGATSMMFDQDLLTKFDQLVVDTNAVAVVAAPDAGTGYSPEGAGRRLFSCVKNAVIVGSRTGDHEIFPEKIIPVPDMPALPASRIDCVGTQQYTSYGAPEVAAIACCIIDQFDRAGLIYSWKDIRRLILNGCTSIDDPRFAAGWFGAGQVNLANSLRLTAEFIAQAVPVIPPAQPIENMFEDTYLEAAGFSETNPFYVASNQYVHVPVHPLIDSGKNYADGVYTVPADGVYRVGHSVRLCNDLSPRSYGMGVEMIDYDGRGFNWQQTGKPSGSKISRNTNSASREQSFKKGDQLRLVAYVDYSTIETTPIWYASMTIRRVL